MGNIGDVIDKLIMIIIGVVLIIYGLNPGFFLKNEESLRKIKKMKLFFLIIGSISIIYSVSQIIIFYIKR